MTQPVIISTWSFGRRGSEAAWPELAGGGSSIDAVERVCAVVDADPEVDSVGYGGLPDRAGDVTLDGCIMLSPAQCAGVCATARHLHPVSVARRVMEKTDHMLLAGERADVFARTEGFGSNELISSEAHERWEAWNANPTVIDQSADGSLQAGTGTRPIDRGRGGRLFEPLTEADWKHHDTVGTLAVDRAGVMAGACSTSGTPYKVPGRVGDSPIIGHGLYVLPGVGGATATGTGELISSVCASFLVVEELRRGSSLIDALLVPLRRIAELHDLRADHQVAVIGMTPDGRRAAAALRGGFLMSETSAEDSTSRAPDAVLLD